MNRFRHDLPKRGKLKVGPFCEMGQLFHFVSFPP